LIFVFDTNSLSNILRNYFPETFSSFWRQFGALIENKAITSVREVKGELEEKFDKTLIGRFEIYCPDFFTIPSLEELRFIPQIYAIKHFQQNLDRKKILKGGNFADPFVIAKAKIIKGIVVTEETFKEHAAKIPNICHHFNVGYLNLENFLKTQKWNY